MHLMGLKNIVYQNYKVYLSQIENSKIYQLNIYSIQNVVIIDISILHDRELISYFKNIFNNCIKYIFQILSYLIFLN